VKCGVGIYAASDSCGNLERGKQDFERHITNRLQPARGSPLLAPVAAAPTRLIFGDACPLAWARGIYRQSRSRHRYLLRRGDTMERGSVDRLVMKRSKPTSRRQKGPKESEAI
jgi:hypothetical protein